MSTARCIRKMHKSMKIIITFLPYSISLNFLFHSYNSLKLSCRWKVHPNKIKTKHKFAMYGYIFQSSQSYWKQRTAGAHTGKVIMIFVCCFNKIYKVLQRNSIKVTLWKKFWRILWLYEMICKHNAVEGIKWFSAFITSDRRRRNIKLFTQKRG